MMDSVVSYSSACVCPETSGKGEYSQVLKVCYLRYKKAIIDRLP